MNVTNLNFLTKSINSLSFYFTTSVNSAFNSLIFYEKKYCFPLDGGS